MEGKGARAWGLMSFGEANLEIAGAILFVWCAQIDQRGHVCQDHGPGPEVAPHAQDGGGNTHHGPRNFCHPERPVHRCCMLKYMHDNVACFFPVKGCGL